VTVEFRNMRASIWRDFY